VCQGKRHADGMQPLAAVPRMRKAFVHIDIVFIEFQKKLGGIDARRLDRIPPVRGENRAVRNAETGITFEERFVNELAAQGIFWI
jgi:hypothetical protein